VARRLQYGLARDLHPPASAGDEFVVGYSDIDRLADVTAWVAGS